VPYETSLGYYANTLSEQTRRVILGNSRLEQVPYWSYRTEYANRPPCGWPAFAGANEHRSDGS